jgi:hypothetical protein
VIDIYVRVSLVGIEPLTIDARIVIASVDTYLRFARAVNRLDLESGTADKQNLTEFVGDTAEAVTSGVAKGKTDGGHRKRQRESATIMSNNTLEIRVLNALLNQETGWARTLLHDLNTEQLNRLADAADQLAALIDETKSTKKPNGEALSPLTQAQPTPPT